MTGTRDERRRATGPGLILTGWRPAVGWSVGAALAGAAMAEAVVFAAAAAGGPGASRPPGELTARAGGVLFLWFHHAGVSFGPEGGVSGFGFTVAFAMLAATAVLAWILARGGRAVAERALDGGAGGLAAALHGTKIAVPYAATCTAAAAAVRFVVSLPSNPVASGALRVRASFPSAVLWPLGLAAAAGLAGGLRAGPRRRLPERLFERRLRAAVAGGWRMAVLGLALSFGGLLVLAVVHPGDTRAYFDAVFRRGALPGATLVGLTALVTPNLAAWVLFPSMGSCVALAGRTTACLLSYGQFPSRPTGGAGILGRLAPVGQTAAPAGYLLFLVVPVAAVVLGGVRAASRGAATSRWDAARLGGSAGVVFAAIAALLVALSSVSGSVSVGAGASPGSGFRIGPDPVRSVALALLWGVVGGAIGGAFAARPERRAPGEPLEPDPEPELAPDALSEP